MLSENDVRLGKPVQDAVSDHRVRTPADFLCGLEHRDNRSRPRRLELIEQPKSADQRGDMHIVAARVHDRDVLAVRVRRADGARIG
ncbi:Uncharacterised protein [Mycobacteroides abscessus subsp. abscessus]|nr:Uncharacterised protein [Mycobacteroides abscessus subsp. abscessus]SLE77274.1 Uncharacterised protein [Mycobacteroides abscessus subsp. massiliense]